MRGFSLSRRVSESEGLYARGIHGVSSLCGVSIGDDGVVLRMIYGVNWLRSKIRHTCLHPIVLPWA